MTLNCSQIQDSLQQLLPHQTYHVPLPIHACFYCSLEWNLYFASQLVSETLHWIRITARFTGRVYHLCLIYFFVWIIPWINKSISSSTLETASSSKPKKKKTEAHHRLYLSIASQTLISSERNPQPDIFICFITLPNYNHFPVNCSKNLWKQKIFGLAYIQPKGERLDKC